MVSVAHRRGSKIRRELFPTELEPVIGHISKNLAGTWCIEGDGAARKFLGAQEAIKTLVAESAPPDSTGAQRVVANPLETEIETELTSIIRQLSDESSPRNSVFETTRVLPARLDVVRSSDSSVSETLPLGKLIELVNRAQSVLEAGGEFNLARLLLEQAKLNWLSTGP
jgi:hypothetical protein